MKLFDFDHVNEVHLVGLVDFEFVVDAHQDGNASAMAVWGPTAKSIAMQTEDAVVTVIGQDEPRATRALSISGTFISGNLPIPLIPVPRSPLRIRHGGLGDAPVTIELSLPPGKRVVLRGPFKTIVTAAPRERVGEPRGDFVPREIRVQAEALLAAARAERLNGSLSAAIRAHEREREAERLLESGGRK